MGLKTVLMFVIFAMAAFLAVGARFLAPAWRAPLGRRSSSPPAPQAPPPPPVIFSFLDNRPIALPLGWRPEHGQRPFVMTEGHLSHHQLILGTTGSGKSRFAELQCRFFIDSLRGFCYLDPDGDTCDNLLAYALKKCEEEGTDAIIKQIVYIELSFATLFGYDPFVPPDFTDLSEPQRENAYRAWLSVKVDQFSEIVQSKQGNSDFTGMARLQRVLRTVLYAVGTAVTDDGRHLPLSEIFALLDCDHTRHDDIYRLVRDHLPDDISAEFERWQGCDRRQRLLETESTLNRLRSLLSPLVLAIFTEPARRIKFRDLIDQRMILLVNLRQSDYVSADQQRAVGAFFLHEIWTACKVKERESRSAIPYYLFVDEAHVYMETAGADLLSILERGRKYKVSLTLIGQFLGQFKNERVDMIPAILNLCRSFACFLHMSPDDLQILKQYFGYPNLNFEELYQVMDRPDGNEFIKLTDYARNYTCGTNWTKSTSTEQSQSASQTNAHGVGNMTGSSVADGQQQSKTDSATKSEGKGKQLDPKGHTNSRSENENTTGSTSAAQAKSHVEAKSASQTVTDTESNTVAASTSQGQAAGAGGNEGIGFTESEKTAILPKTREEWHPTGRLRYAVEDQFHCMAHVLSTLQNRQAMVRLFGETRTFRMDVADVPDVFPDPIQMARALAAFKEKIYARHDFYFVPDLSPSAQKNRLAQWLNEMQTAREEKRAAVEQEADATQENSEKNPMPD
jgi:hypothetical protein